MKAYSCGTYSNSVAVYVEGTKESVLMLTDVPVGSGITCQRWNPNGNHLWVGGRHSSNIICYDLRSTRGELGRVSRRLETNQKLTFDLDPWGKHLITGSQDGEVLVYGAMDFQLEHRLVTNDSDDENSKDANCTNSVSCHPHSALLCLATGQRVIDSDEDEDEDEDDEEEEGTDGQDRMSTRAPKVSTSTARPQSRKSSSGLRLVEVGADKLAYPVAHSL
jgi:WD40 repeat protein